MLVLFSILSVGLYRTVSSCLNISTRIERGFICRYLARSACVLAQAQEGKDETAYDTLHEFSEKQERQIDNTSFEFIAEDENSKLNINSSSIQMLAMLPGLDEDTAGKIAASDLRPYAAIEELLDVDGITEEAYKDIENFITVHSSGSVNINTAGREVLAALGFDESLISVIISFRAGADTEEGTQDDEAFEDIAYIVPKLRARGISQAQEAELLNLINQGAIGIESKCRTLKITASISGKAVNQYRVILDANRIKQWKEL